MGVVLPRPSCTECSGAVELRRKCTINSYVCVIGMVADDFNIRTIIASDVRPVKSGNEIILCLLLMDSINCSVHRVFEPQQESPEKMLLRYLVWVFWPIQKHFVNNLFGQGIIPTRIQQNHLMQNCLAYFQW